MAVGRVYVRGAPIIGKNLIRPCVLHSHDILLIVDYRQWILLRACVQDN